MSFPVRYKSLRHAAKQLLLKHKYSTMAKNEKDWNANEDFFRFSRGRFIFDEDHNMSIRTVHFDMNHLAKIVAGSLAAQKCTNIEKCPDGMYNKSFLFTMDDGRQVIGKVPNPNAGLPHFTTASEVATMDYVRNVLGTPAPHVYAWCSRAENPVGAEYVIMEKMPGVPLLEVWEKMKLPDKLQIILQLVKYQKQWLSIRFRQIGSLYYKTDIESSASEGLLYYDSHEKNARDERFAVGPAMGRAWVDAGRSSLTCCRGPWNSVLDYHRAVLQREVDAIKSAVQLPKQMIMVCAPTLYQPTHKKKLAALESSARVVKYLIPSDPSICASHLWHNDLHVENIFVDPVNQSKITGIIDWQSTQVVPLFENTIDPGILDYNGPDIESLDEPVPPENFKQLSKAERNAEIRLLNSKALLIAYRRLIQKSAPLKAASDFRASTAYTILNLSQRVFEIGEAHLHAIICQLGTEWNDLSAVREAGQPSFPINFSKAQTQQLEEDAKAADASIQMMNEIETRLGNLWPDKGAVQNEHYDDTKEFLKQAKEEILHHLALNDEQVKEMEESWPFDC